MFYCCAEQCAVSTTGCYTCLQPHDTRNTCMQQLAGSHLRVPQNDTFTERNCALGVPTRASASQFIILHLLNGYTTRSKQAEPLSVVSLHGHWLFDFVHGRNATYLCLCSLGRPRVIPKLHMRTDRTCSHACMCWDHSGCKHFLHYYYLDYWSLHDSIPTYICTHSGSSESHRSCLLRTGPKRLHSR